MWYDLFVLCSLGCAQHYFHNFNPANLQKITSMGAGSGFLRKDVDPVFFNEQLEKFGEGQCTLEFGVLTIVNVRFTKFG